MELKDILFASVLLVIATIAIVGNMLVILAVISHRRLQNPANYLIVNLALSDFLQGAVSMPVRLAEVLNTSDRNLIRCDVVIGISILFHGASNLNLALIALDRFIAVSKPFAYANFVKTSSYKIVIACAWTFIFILAFSPVIGWRRDQSAAEAAGNICRYGTTLTREYLILHVFLINCVPLVIMFFTYTYIFRTTRKQIRQIRAQEIAVTNAAINQACDCRKNSQSNCEDSQNEADVRKEQDSQPSIDRTQTAPANNNNREITNSRKMSTVSNLSSGRKVPLSTVRSRKVTRTVLAIIGFFLVLCLPISIIDTVELFCKSCEIPSWVTTVAIWMVSANSCVNVFVYGGYNTDYRTAYRKVWHKTKNGVSRPFVAAMRNNQSPPLPPTQAT